VEDDTVIDSVMIKREIKMLQWSIAAQRHKAQTIAIEQVMLPVVQELYLTAHINCF